MTKIKLGRETFQAEQLKADGAWDQFHPDHEAWKHVWRIDQVETMYWSCPSETEPQGKRRPEPFPTKFKWGEAVFRIRTKPKKPSLLNPFGGTLGSYSKELSETSARKIALGCGFANVGALYASLPKQFGSYAPTFDADALIAKEKDKACFAITARLRYQHFRLTHPSVKGFVFILLSLPDRVELEAVMTHICTAGHKQPVFGYLRPPDIEQSSVVRAKTKDAHRLRKKLRDDEKAKAKARIRELEARLREIKKELAEIKPKAEEGGKPTSAGEKK